MVFPCLSNPAWALTCSCPERRHKGASSLLPGAQPEPVWEAAHGCPGPVWSWRGVRILGRSLGGQALFWALELAGVSASCPLPFPPWEKVMCDQPADGAPNHFASLSVSFLCRGDPDDASVLHSPYYLCPAMPGVLVCSCVSVCVCVSIYSLPRADVGSRKSEGAMSEKKK